MKRRISIESLLGPDQEMLVETAPHSMEVTTNAKGEVSCTIKLYFRDEQKAEIFKDIQDLHRQYETFRQTYEAARARANSTSPIPDSKPFYRKSRRS